LTSSTRSGFQSTAGALEAREGIIGTSRCVAFHLGATALFVIFLFTLLIFTDVNKSRKYRKDLEVARSRAEDLMESREKLLLTVTHDIKAPLSSIVGYLDLMRQSSDNSYVGPMIHSAEHVMELLANLLEYYRLESQKNTTKPCTYPYKTFF